MGLFGIMKGKWKTRWTMGTALAGFSSSLIDDKKNQVVSGVCSVPVVLWRGDFCLQGHWPAIFERHLRKYQLWKYFFLADSATYTSGLTKTTNRGGKRARKIQETFDSWKKKLLSSNWEQSIQDSSRFIGTEEGLFLAETYLISWQEKSKLLKNISPDLFSKFSTATALP